jgi:hypothetical protein
MPSPGSPRKIIMPPPPLVALAAWIVPGLGYVLIGQRLRGLVVGITILLIFLSGLLIGGMKVIDTPPGLLPQQVLHNHAWYIPQVLAGPVTPAAGYIADHWTQGRVVGVPMSHARVYEIGVLYTAVAGLLNLMAMIDSSYRAANEGAR